jgi:hypothetical protein
MIDHHYGHLARDGYKHAIRLLNRAAVKVLGGRWLTLRGHQIPRPPSTKTREPAARQAETVTLRSHSLTRNFSCARDVERGANGANPAGFPHSRPLRKRGQQRAVVADWRHDEAAGVGGSFTRRTLVVSVLVIGAVLALAVRYAHPLGALGVGLPRQRSLRSRSTQA